MHISKINSYDKVLDKEKLREFTRGIGLAAHGIGIGSFVYLRRIIEFFIEEAHQVAIKDQSWKDEPAYLNLKVGQRIESLKSFLPPILVEARKVYSILSKGIHELTEKECLDYFQPLKVIIELILDDREIERKRREKEKEAKDAIAKISGKI